MSRLPKTMIALGLCLAGALAAMAWISAQVLDLDRRVGQARQEAALEENVRLALWRMDSKVAPVIYRETALPASEYLQADKAGGASDAPDFARLRFTISPDGAITSSPAKNESKKTTRRMRGKDSINRRDKSDDLGLQLLSFIDRERLAAALPEDETDQVALLDVAPNQQWDNNQDVQAAQSMKNVAEFNQRSVANDKLRSYLGQTKQPDIDVEAARSGYVWPVWIKGELVLARRTWVGKGAGFQGAWMDWSALKSYLLGEVEDLLPEADLVAAGSDDEDERGRLMASLPVKLVPGAAVSALPAPGVPVRMMLAIAWGGFVVAALALGFLLFGAVRLSERRGAFVSAVTHELRTPLTTFRMYTEMLASGMVEDEDKKKRYLETLRAEADRLGHLVENVLAYSRLEKKRDANIETVAADELIEGVRDLLAERAGRAGMTLDVELPERPPTARADRGAVERILFNLVDNACKYAASADDKRICVKLESANGRAVVKVRDRGPGIPKKSARRLFQPFSRPAEDAAGSAPGVGLGLALSKKLARAMGGDLNLDPDVKNGSCFVLTLPGG